MRGALTWSAALTFGFGVSGLVASAVFNALDGIGLLDWLSTCGEVLCDADIVAFALTVAGWLALGAWLTWRTRRWIESRFSPPAP
jgi:hypothetical protein